MGAASAGDPQSLNMYAYCGNDPINHIDPDGLFFGKLFKWIKKAIKWAVIAVAVIAAVALTVAAFSTSGGAGAAIASFLWDSIVTPALNILSQLAGLGPAAAMPTGPGGTPVWNPNAGTGLSSGRWRRYVFHQNGRDTEVIRTVTNACKNGNRYPDCGHWYSGLARAVAGGIAVAIALGNVAYQNLAVQEQRFGVWFLRRMDEGSKIQIGTRRNGEPIYMGIPVAGMTRVPTTAFGRSIQSLEAGEGAWRTVAAHAETAQTFKNAVSYEEVFQNIATGERIYRHTIVRGDKVLHRTWRKYSKFGRQ